MVSELVTTLPWYVNVLFVSAITFCLVTLFRMLRDKSPGRQAEFAEAKQLAERLASREYFVQYATEVWGALLLTLATADSNRLPYSLLISAKHPDIQSLRMVQRLDRIGFQFIPEPDRRMSRGEICSYLKKK